jgi:hypothetical protein
MTSFPDTPQPRPGIVELYTKPTFRNDTDWQSVISTESCADIGGRCCKSRKSLPELTIGTCTVAHNVRSPKNVIVCPKRFLERNQIFLDCIHLLTRHEPGNALHCVSEVTIPGGSVDFCLASVRKGRVVDFVGIELQAVDTTGTVWSERQRFLASVGIEVEETADSGYGINWKMSAKTILIQLHHKVQTFERLDRRFVLVLQDHFLRAMQQSFSFDHIGGAKLGDVMHFHAYSLAQGVDEYRIELAERLSTDSGGVGASLGLQTSPSVELETILSALEQKSARSLKNTLLPF